MATTVTIFPIAATDATGRISPSVSYSGSGAALFRLLSNTWISDSPSIRVDFQLQQSFDNGLTWANMCATLWNPPLLNKDGSLPAEQCTAQDAAGNRLLRVILSATSSIQVGLSVTI